MSELQQREAALMTLLKDADFVHWKPSELAEDVPTERGLVGESVWTQALQLVGRYEPLRPLYARRDVAQHQPGRTTCLNAPEFGLWRLRYDLNHLTPGDEMTVGVLVVRRVWCKYGSRWVIRRGGAKPFGNALNEFDALMELKDDYMADDTTTQTSDVPVILSATLLHQARLSVDALAVYVHMLGFALDSRRDGRPPTHGEIAAVAGVSEKRVISAVRELEDKKVIVVQRVNGGQSLYTFLEWCGTSADGSGSYSYSYKESDSSPKSKKRIATPSDGSGVRQSEHSPEETQAIAALLKAWKDASGAAGSPFANKTYRMQALELHHCGVTADDVTRYVKSLLAEAFWKKNGVTWGKVASNVRAWAGKLDKPAAVQVPVDPFAGQAPQRIG